MECSECLLVLFGPKFSSSPLFPYWFSVWMTYQFLRVEDWSLLLLLHCCLFLPSDLLTIFNIIRCTNIKCIYIGLAKNFGPKDVTEKPERTFWPTKYLKLLYPLDELTPLSLCNDHLCLLFLFWPKVCGLRDLQDGRGVRRGDHLPPNKYVRNTSTCGTTLTEHLLNAGRRPQTSQRARNSPSTWIGQKMKEKTETKE